MAEAPRSAAQLAEATGLPMGRVRRYIREMREEGLIESVTRKSKRGTVEHFNLLIDGILQDEDDVAERPIFTDDAGWEELANLHRDFYNRILEIREQIAARLEKEEEEGFKASSVFLFFESETTD